MSSWKHPVFFVFMSDKDKFSINIFYKTARYLLHSFLFLEGNIFIISKKEIFLVFFDKVHLHHQNKNQG